MFKRGQQVFIRVNGYRNVAHSIVEHMINMNHFEVMLLSEFELIR